MTEEKSEVKFAGFWIRILANFLDNIFASLVGLIAGLAAVFISLAATAIAARPAINPDTFTYSALIFISTNGLGILLGLLSVLGQFLFIPFCWHFWGGTPAKLILGLKIVQAKPGGILNYPSFRKAYLRLFALLMISYFLPALIAVAAVASSTYGGFIILLFPLVYLSSAAFLAFHPYKRGLHDVMAGTAVVYARNKEEIASMKKDLSLNKLSPKSFGRFFEPGWKRYPPSRIEDENGK